MNRKILYCICAAIFSILLVVLLILNIDRGAPTVSFRIVNPESIHSIRDIQIEVHAHDDKYVDPSMDFEIVGMTHLGVNEFRIAGSQTTDFTQVFALGMLTEEQSAELTAQGVCEVSATVHDSAGHTTTQSFHIHLSEVIH